MRIGVLGAGGMADALATRWAAAGHEVVVGARTPAKAAALAARIGAGARGGTLREAAEFGEAVLVAVHHGAAREALRAAGAGEGTLAGRVVVDCTNPTGPPAFTLETGDGPSAARRIADAAPGARVVKAFNLCHVSVWSAVPCPAAGVPLCGDDAEALAVAGRLVRDLGCEPQNGGGLDRAGLLEAVAAFAIGLYAAGGDPAAMFPPLAAAGGEPVRAGTAEAVRTGAEAE